MLKVSKIFLSFILFTTFFFAQEKNNIKYGVVYKYESNYSSFPHNNRKDGYVYKGQHYKAKDHYSDQSVIIYFPNNFTLTSKVDLVFYFHGWGNNIDSSLTKFNLLEQFYRSKKNAVLVLPEAAKNVPDSYGGKLEEEQVFKNLVLDVKEQIESYYNKQFEIGDISLAGHSGAYRIMAYILMQGGITENIKSVYLFDGLYADIEKYSYWIDNYNGKFINIYTPNGGTKSESENLMLCFDGWGIPYKFIEDDDFLVKDLKQSRITIIKSKLRHSEVIHTKNQFQKFLESSF